MTLTMPSPETWLPELYAEVPANPDPTDAEIDAMVESSRTAPFVRRALRRFADPLGGPGHRLSYRISGGSHVVTHADPAEPLPIAHRYDSVNEARLCWKLIQDRIEEAGYQRA